MIINQNLRPTDLAGKLDHLFALAAGKIRSLRKSWDPHRGTPVFTVKGTYTSRGWTEWTQGFQYGMPLLQFDATGEEEFLEFGLAATLKHMAPHVTHIGVHDHGFNNVSTYGNIRRLLLEGRIPGNDWLGHFCDLALKASGAVQAARWTPIRDGLGYIYSFNGPHSLFSDTIRSLRALAMAHSLGHALMGENDRRISLLERLILHAEATARFNVYYGEGRDHYDVRGRVVHESIFNTNDGNYRCPSTQQGYSPFSTWTRGLSWVLLGYPEQLEFLETLPDEELAPFGGRDRLVGLMEKAALATADFYIEHTAADGIPLWDTGAPGAAALGDYRSRPSEPANPHEPFDSSAAAIAAQGLLRLGRWLERTGRPEAGARYRQAGLTVAGTLFARPYLSEDPEHQGLLLHSIYHRPNGWDHVPTGSRVPNGESSMWGDYHAMELGLYLRREIQGRPYLTFFGQ
ncbi:MAG: glycosyl hydrolase [Bacillota bacterium]